MKIAIAQLNYTIGDIDGNASKIIDSINKAKAQRADLVIFAEQAVSGTPAFDLLRKTTFLELCEDALVEIASCCDGIAAIVGLLIGTPVLRLQGDYLAIVTLAFGEIIKELINCLIIGCDENGLHFIFNPAGSKTVDDLGLSASGTAIIKGAQGATGTATIATFTAGFVLVMITLIVVLNLTRSRAGRAIMAIRDNRIAAQAIGLNLTKYKLMAFVTSAALAGAAGALYGLNYSSLQATKFNFNLSILVLVFVVLGGLGNIWGSLVAAAALTILPEALRPLHDYRMLIYAIVLIFVMLATNNPQAKAFFQKLLPHRRAVAEKEEN